MDIRQDLDVILCAVRSRVLAGAARCALQEYEERLAQLKASYEAEQASRARLEEDITSLRTHYDLKLSALEENLRREAGVDRAGGGCAVRAERSLMRWA